MAVSADYPYRSQQRHGFKYFEKQKAQPEYRTSRPSACALSPRQCANNPRAPAHRVSLASQQPVDRPCRTQRNQGAIRL